MDCIFCKIIAGKIPADIVLDTPDLVAFLDIKPLHLGHTLLIPKAHFESIFDMPDRIWQEMTLELKKLAAKVKKSTGANGINVAMNNLPAAGQIVPHAHFHIIPRFTGDGYIHWKGKDVTREQLREMAEKMRINQG